jgi:hypothetical protein
MSGLQMGRGVDTVALEAALEDDYCLVRRDRTLNRNP